LVERFKNDAIKDGCFKIALETEKVNIGALKLYESLGFYREMLYRNYYQNGNDAYGLVL
jgi:peptide alpha-N-acetyltransferase